MQVEPSITMETKDIRTVTIVSRFLYLHGRCWLNIIENMPKRMSFAFRLRIILLHFFTCTTCVLVTKESYLFSRDKNYNQGRTRLQLNPARAGSYEMCATFADDAKILYWRHPFDCGFSSWCQTSLCCGSSFCRCSCKLAEDVHVRQTSQLPISETVFLRSRATSPRHSCRLDAIDPKTNS